MSSEKIMQYEGTQLAYMAGMTLKDLAEAFSQRRFCTSDGGTLAIPKEVQVEWELKRKDSGKVKLEIEISWVEEGAASAQ